MSRWFRMYNEVLDDPKVQRLSDADFKAWVNLLCLASRSDGLLPPLSDIGFALRIDPKKAKSTVERLVSAGLIETDGDCFTPHKWNDRQYKSDVSTGRVKRFRERSKGVSETASETAPDTETDTEKSSVDKSTASEPENAPPADPEKIMFDHGIAYLAGAGIAASRARPMLGRWKRDHGAAAVIEALGTSQRQGAIDPISFIEGRFKAVKRVQAEVPIC